MAIAQRGGSTTDDASGSGSGADKTSLVLTKPTGVVEGDVLIALWTANGVSVTPPTGFNLVVSQIAGTSTVTTKLYYKVAGASEPSTYTFTCTAGPVLCSMVAFSGVDNANPIDASSGFATSGTTTSTEARTTPTTNNNAQQGRVFYYRSAMIGSDTALTFTGASGTELFDDTIIRTASSRRSHAMYCDTADFSGGGATKAGLAITCGATETQNTDGTFVLRAQLVTSAGTAAVTGTANAPTLTRSNATGDAASTATANAPIAAQGRLAGTASVTAVANSPASTTHTAAPGQAAATAVANAPTTAATVPAGTASAAATAYGPTVQFGIQALAGHAAVTATAYAPTVDLDDTTGDAGNAAATGVANQPVTGHTANAGTASVTAVAYNPTVFIGESGEAGTAAATATANQPVSAHTANAGTATATATAYGPTVTLGAAAGTATATATANTPSAAHTAAAGTATVTATAYGAVGTSIIPGADTGLGTENASVKVAGSDTGSGLDAEILAVQTTATDAGVATDTATVIVYGADSSGTAFENAIAGRVGFIGFERVCIVDLDPEVTRPGDPDGRTRRVDMDAEVAKPGDDDARTMFVEPEEEVSE